MKNIDKKKLENKTYSHKQGVVDAYMETNDVAWG